MNGTLKKIIVFLFCGIIFLVQSCTNKNDENEHPCDDVKFCTELFASVGLELKFVSIQKNNFQNIETFLDSTGKKIFSNTLNSPIFSNEPGINITFITDNEKDKVTFEGTPITVKFYSTGGGLIKEEKFVIRHDCCHVEKVSGPDVVEI